MEKVNSTMGSRFKQVRVELNMRQGDFASEIQSSQGHVSDIENGRKNVSDKTVEILALKFHVNEHWLRTGEGEMFLPGPKSVLEEVSEKLNLNEFETAFMKVYLRLPKQVRDNFCNGLYDELFKIKQPDAEPTESRWERESRLLQEEAEAVKKDGEKCSALPPSKEA